MINTIVIILVGILAAIAIMAAIAYLFFDKPTPLDDALSAEDNKQDGVTVSAPLPAPEVPAVSEPCAPKPDELMSGTVIKNINVETRNG